MILDWGFRKHITRHHSVPSSLQRARNTWVGGHFSSCPLSQAYKDRDVGQLKNRNLANRRADSALRPKAAV
jgi:hypothetical protein